MADEDSDPIQQPASTPEAKRIEEFALLMLSQVQKKSVHGGPSGKPREWGGIIYVVETGSGSTKQGALGATRYEGYATVRVDVRDKLPNMGCPPGTRPVAWYHTHPVEGFEAYGGDHFTASSKEFIGGDKDLSDTYLLPGYVATRDNRFWRYDPPPQAKTEDGKPLFYNGKPVTDMGKEGYFGVLKPRVTPL